MEKNLYHMKIKLEKFGTILTSRDAGKEDLISIKSILKSVPSSEVIEIDFGGIFAFSPGWGDEFLTPLQKQFGDFLVLKNIKNPSVSLTLEMLEKINNVKFIVK